MVADLYFFDLPVYRLGYDEYNRTMKDKLDLQLDSMRQIHGYEPSQSTKDAISQHQYERFGPWRFNEILGYIRLHFLGSQVRGEYFSAEKKRNPIGRNRVFIFRTLKLAAEIGVSHPWPATNAQIWSGIQSYVNRCRKELARGRVVDDTLLNVVGPHTDWIAILGWNSADVRS